MLLKRREMAVSTGSSDPSGLGHVLYINCSAKGLPAFAVSTVHFFGIIQANCAKTLLH